jgi:hypothetical protein
VHEDSKKKLNRMGTDFQDNSTVNISVPQAEIRKSHDNPSLHKFLTPAGFGPQVMIRPEFRA